MPILSATTDPVAMRLLLVEDDTLLGDGLEAGLAQAGFDVDWVRDGVAALNAVDAGGYAAVILDIGLPRLAVSTYCGGCARAACGCRS